MYNANDPKKPPMSNDQTGRKRDTPEDNPMITHERPSKVIRRREHHTAPFEHDGSASATLPLFGSGSPITFGNNDGSATSGSNNGSRGLPSIDLNEPIDINAAVFGNYDLSNVGRQLDPVVLGNNLDSSPPVERYASASSYGQLDTHGDLGSSIDLNEVASDTHGHHLGSASSFRQLIATESNGHHLGSGMYENLGSSSFENVVSSSSSANARHLGSGMYENLGSSSFENIVSSSIERFGYGIGYGEARRSTAEAYFQGMMEHLNTYLSTLRKH